VEFTGSRSPAPLPSPRERDRGRDIWDGKRETRDDYHTKVALDIQKGKDHDNTNVLTTPKVFKTMQEGERGP
jgi:hypothetical protein